MGCYSALIKPLLFRFDAETAHRLGVWGAAHVLRGPLRWTMAYTNRPRDPRLAQRLWGIDFPAPIGIAAGLDKDGVAIKGLACSGASQVEIGTITGQAQPGNPLPRLFRLPADDAVINRMGFNNAGAAAIAARLTQRYDPPGGRRRPPCALGINLGKSKVVDLSAALDDYRASVRLLGALADYLVVNVSSPNTPGLRDLQGEALLRPLLAGVRAELDAVTAPRRVPLLLKIAPDLAEPGIDAAVDVALETGCDGLIATNTTITRGGLRTDQGAITAIGAGGLSGRPLRLRATTVLARVARRVRASPRPVPIIGVGGVDSADAAWEKIVHGASLVQVYTGLIYHGPGLIARIHRGLSAKLDTLKLASLSDAIGRDLG